MKFLVRKSCAQEQNKIAMSHFKSRYNKLSDVYKFWNLPLLDHPVSAGVGKLQIRGGTRSPSHTQF
jgi:hypothetical protein